MKKDINLLIASKSPRRQELIRMLDIPFKVVEGIEVDETYPDDIEKILVPEYLSKLKSEAYKSLLTKKDILITADTIVLLDDCILGKPTDLDDAKRMLSLLQNRAHKVITGVTLTSKEKTISFSVITEVEFSPLSKEEIDYYVEKYRPLDKAGAYGIQEWIGAVGVKGIIGSFYNVMGLPVNRLHQELQKF